jgi:hypothetical protein
VSAAGRQAVTGLLVVYVLGGQAVRAVVAVLDARDRLCGKDQVFTADAFKVRVDGLDF